MQKNQNSAEIANSHHAQPLTSRARECFSAGVDIIDILKVVYVTGAMNSYECPFIVGIITNSKLAKVVVPTMKTSCRSPESL